MSNKYKYYKNPSRGKTNNVSPYVPQYKELGLDPQPHKMGSDSSSYLIVQKQPSISLDDDLNNPRRKKIPITQPYATVDESNPVKLNKGELPNNGNNVEHTWFTVDGIDVSASEDEIQESNIKEEDILPTVEEDITKESEISDDGQYIIIYNDKIISTGTKESIQELASSLVFGEHPLCNGKPISVENILVLKKVKINIGLFLD